jgi:hypothetical protein
MNIDRVAPRASEIGLRRTELPSQPFDLTISDQGVLPNQGLQVAKEEAPASLNSSPGLGQMLSVEETRALREAFAPAAESGAPEARPGGGVYTIGGQAARAAQGAGQGRTLDVTG